MCFILLITKKKKKNVSFKLFCLYSSKQELKKKKNTYIGKYIYVYKMPISCTHYILISHVLS